MTDDRSLDITPRADFADRLEADLLRQIAAPGSPRRRDFTQPQLEQEETIMTIEPTARRPRRPITLYTTAAAAILLVILGIALLHGSGGADRSPATVAPSSVAVATIPDGVYRNSISVDEVRAVNISTALGWSGTWTLTIHGDTFKLHCAPASQKGEDCGTNNKAGIVEVGRLHQKGDQVTFTSDTEALAKATGCHVTTDPADESGCGAPRPYTMTWTATSDTLTFSVLTPDTTTEWNYIIKPMKKVG